MLFKTLKAEELLKLIQPFKENDPLSLEQRREQEYFKHLVCIRCNKDVSPFLNARQPFKKGKLTPNMLAKCGACGCEFEPYTKIEVKGPTNLDDLI